MSNSKVSDSRILAQARAARTRETQERERGLRASSARYDRTHGRIVLELSNGFLFAFPVQCVPALKAATSAQRSRVKVDSSGSVLRWNDMDIDLSVPGLLLSALGAQEKRRHLASMVGKSTSSAKAAAARANGMKGGRPKG
jgi:hypothetical protein